MNIVAEGLLVRVGSVPQPLDLPVPPPVPPAPPLPSPPIPPAPPASVLTVLEPPLLVPPESPCPVAPVTALVPPTPPSPPTPVVVVAVAPWVAVLLEMLAAFVVDVPATLEFAKDVVGPPAAVATPVFPGPDVPAVFPETASALPAPSPPPLQP